MTQVYLKFCLTFVINNCGAFYYIFITLHIFYLINLLGLLINFYLTNSPAACLPGSFMEHWNDEKECQPCPKGTHQGKSGAYFCKVCRRNFTTLHEGTVTDSACRPHGFKRVLFAFYLRFIWVFFYEIFLC